MFYKLRIEIKMSSEVDEIDVPENVPSPFGSVPFYNKGYILGGVSRLIILLNRVWEVGSERLQTYLFE